jgi:hypothetical protein
MELSGLVGDRTGVRRVQGFGGAKNDTRVVIAEGSECVNYLNGNRASTFYDSGPKTIGKIDVTLRNGEYCIIFDNRNSVVSSKEVAAKIFLKP